MSKEDHCIGRVSLNGNEKVLLTKTEEWFDVTIGDDEYIVHVIHNLVNSTKEILITIRGKLMGVANNSELGHKIIGLINNERITQRPPSKPTTLKGQLTSWSDFPF